MSVRVDYTEVQEILDTDLTSGVITALIADASLWVDEHLADSVLSASTLAAIEKYIAAHLCVQAGESGEGQVVQATRADISERYAERKDAANGATSYIRTAAAFDRTGKVREHWMGGVRVMWRTGEGYNATQAPSTGG